MIRFNIIFKLRKEIFFFIFLVASLILASCTKNQYLSKRENFEESSVRASKEIESSFVSHTSSSPNNKGTHEIIAIKPATGDKQEKGNDSKKKISFTNCQVKDYHKEVKKAIEDASFSPSDEVPVKKTNPRAKRAFIFSVVGFFIPILGIILMSLGFANGIKAMNEIRKNRREYKGMGYALAAWIIPIAFIVLLLVAAYLYLVYSLLTDEYSDY